MRRFIAIFLVCCMSALVLCACGEVTAENAKSGERYKVYDDDGNLVGYECQYHNTYDYLTRLDVYDAQENYDHYVLYEYDTQGRLIQETTYAANGLGQFYYSYEYDDDDNIIEEGYYTADQGCTITKLDSNGNKYEVLTYDKYAELLTREVLEEDGEWRTYDADDKEITE